MGNVDVQMNLDEAIEEVLGLLTGLDLQYLPTSDRYQSLTRALNRALRANALETDWSYYASTEVIGTAVAGERSYTLRASLRPRIISDDAVRLVKDGVPVAWAYFLPRDALHKYAYSPELRCAATRQTLTFSRPLPDGAAGCDIEVPVMREPRMFRLPEMPEDPNVAIPAVPLEVRQQLLDFDYPDVVIMRAAFFYAQTDPVMQPRVQTLEAQYKDLMYQLIERDEKHTDSPYMNDFLLPISSDIYGTPRLGGPQPLADSGRN